MTVSEASLETRQPGGRRFAVLVFFVASGLLLGLMVWLRVWVSSVETFDRQGQFTTPARPPTPPVYDPGPGFAKGSEQVFALKEPEGPAKGLLARELVRQGVMIAAQDALGLALLD